MTRARPLNMAKSFRTGICAGSSETGRAAAQAAEHDLRPPAGQLADPGGQQAELTAELGLGDISRPSQARDVAVPDNQAHQLRHPVRGSLPEESTASTMNTRPCGPGGRHSPRT